MSNSNNDFQRAEKAVAAAEAAVTSARSVCADIEAKRGDAVRRGTDLADERANVALAAHTGDAQAAQRLKEIHQQIAVHGSELASLDAALRAAADKVEHAKSQLAVEVRKVDALKLRDASHAFTSHMRKLDKALDQLVNTLFDAEPIRQRLNALGVAPSYAQFVALGERPLAMAIGDTIFEGRNIGRRLAPSERTTFSQLAASWTKQHDATVADILGEEQTKSTEAA